MTALQFFLCTALPVTGMCYALIGALKLPLVERLKIDEAKVGGLLSAFGIMFGPVILAAGFLSDSLGRHPHFPALRSAPMALSGASRTKQIPSSKGACGEASRAISAGFIRGLETRGLALGCRIPPLSGQISTMHHPQ